MRTLILAAIALTAMLHDAPRAAAQGLQVGDRFLLTREIDRSGEDNHNGTSTSFDRDTVTERVLALRDGGAEIEFDAAPDAKADSRVSMWQFPARVFEPAEGPIILLNPDELSARVDPWLEAAQIPREACGRWTFTWNVYRIECDPQSAIGIVAGFDLRPGSPSDGALFTDPAASLPGRLRQTAPGRFEVTLEIDAHKIRQGMADSDVVVGEISGTPVTLEAAAQAHARDRITGTIAVTIETNADGLQIRRTSVTRMEIAYPDGRIEKNTATETLTRKPIQPRVTDSDA